MAFDGTPVGIYREGDDLMPIIARHVEADRQRAAGELDVLQVQPTLALKTLPLSQVTEGIDLEWEDPIITRFNRRREVAIQAAPDGVTFPTLRSAVVDKFDAIEVINGESTPQANKQAHELAKTMKLPGTAGSDAHSPEEPLTVYTEIQAGLNVDEILTAIKKGLVTAHSTTRSIHF